MSRAQLLTLASLVLTAVGVLWFASTLVPIILVELRYSSQRLLTDVFHVTNLKQLIVPTISMNNLSGSTKHKEYAIVIPAIYLDEPVVFNVDPNDEKAYVQALKKGIAHASSTSFPDMGGVGYYFAHSSNPSFRQQLNAVFYLLGKLKTGDQIFIWHEGEQYEYRVTNQKITSATDVSFLDAGQYAHETIVLQTCWPPGTSSKRLLVFAERATE